MGCSGHVIFLFLHFLALLFFGVGLFITIPLHLIFLAMSKSNKYGFFEKRYNNFIDCPDCGQSIREDALKCPYCSTNFELSKKCPFCAETVKKEAIVCKHCGKDLPPLPIEQDKKKEAWEWNKSFFEEKKSD